MDSASEEPKERQPDPDASPQTAKQVIRRAKRYSGRRVSAEDKIRIVMEGLRGEQTVTDLCRREGIQKVTYYKWLKSFLEAGKQRLAGDHLREANVDEVKALKDENDSLKRLLAEMVLENSRLKKSHLE
jgi:transposase